MELNKYKEISEMADLSSKVYQIREDKLFLDGYMSRFKVHNPKTLFPPNFEMLQKNKCPICCRKLYLRADKKLAFCKSKVKDGFVIKGQTLLALGGSLK